MDLFSANIDLIISSSCLIFSLAGKVFFGLVLDCFRVLVFHVVGLSRLLIFCSWFLIYSISGVSGIAVHFLPAGWLGKQGVFGTEKYSEGFNNFHSVDLRFVSFWSQNSNPHGNSPFSHSEGFILVAKLQNIVFYPCPLR